MKNQYIKLCRVSIMSRLAFRSRDPSPVTIETAAKPTKHHIILEATVRPVSLDNYSQNRVAEQAQALKQLRTQGKDLFTMNETRKIESSGKSMYQTVETYGTAMSVEKIIASLKQADLTLRVNFRRPGVHSSSTCMELSAGVLEKLIATSPDENGNKTAELRIKQEQTTTTPSHGSMLVAVTCRGTQHFLSHIDYKILSSYDAMYHEN